ncbi:MAG: hypothetical protein HZB95_11290 [Nitrosomonadales bacterium]|nr:hypothetical protein [Nitrosomonadales bacterium]
MHTTRILIVTLILTSAGAGGYFLYQKHEEEQDAQEIAAYKAQVASQQALLVARLRAATIADAARQPTDKALGRAIPAAYPRSVSDWKSKEKSVYQKLLAAGQFDVLIVPFQIKEYALDRATRSLMTAQLAQAIAAGQKRTPNPYLVARALGEGNRELDRKEVYAFADKIGVKKIIWGYAGHDRHYQMTVSIQLEERNANGLFGTQPITNKKEFDHIPFTDEKPPIEAYQAILPEILTAIGIDNSVLAPAKLDSKVTAKTMPATPLEMVSSNRELARDALLFQLLASLTPRATERTREQFAEKSLLAVYGMTPDSEDYRVLKARAFMLLGLRPAALQLLTDPRTPTENELVAALNGNQPDVERFSSQIKLQPERTIAKLDANHLGQVYANIDNGKSLANAALLKLPGQIWPFLAARAFADGDDWAQFENVYLKQLLDHEFPIKDYTLEGIVRGGISLGDEEKLQTMLDLSVITHIRKLIDSDTAKWCCQPASARLSNLDYLDLIEAIGNDNLMRQAHLLTKLQGIPERALSFLKRIEGTYKGHPAFTLALAQAQIGSADAADGAEKDGFLKSAYANLFNVMYWEQGQSVLSAAAFDELDNTGRQDYGYFDNFFASDYPFRPYYPNWESGGRPEYWIPNAEAALRNSTSDLKALRDLDWSFKQAQQNDKRDALFKSIEGRFAGNSELYHLRAQNSLDSGDIESAQKYYRQSIKAQPIVWQPYMELGNLLIEQGQLQAAYRHFMTYPGFKNGSTVNPVAISNYAYEAGSKFYWLGEFSLATPLYQLASRLETGSNADISSRLRLKLLNGDHRGALMDSLERAKRYNNSYAYRDYLGMLHAMGASKDAWAAFNVLSGQIDAPHIWETVLVGHRIEGKPETEIATWVHDEVAQNIGKADNHAANYLLRAGVMDRVPSKELSEAVSALATPVWKVNFGSGFVVRPSANGNLKLVLGPKSSEGSTLPIGAFDISEKSRVKADISYFTEAYRAIRTGEFRNGRTLLQEASTLYDLSMERFGYILPYYAFASAKAGDITAVETYLAGFSPEHRGFDFLLAKAILLGISGKTDESIHTLKRALYKRPFTEERPLPTEYEYAEICMWLYETTGNRKYKEITLDWAKKNQKFQPWFSWAYAMEAVLSENKPDRRQAIAMTLYLDPHSELLNKIPKRERKEAEKAFGKKNPFLIQSQASEQPQQPI